VAPRIARAARRVRSTVRAATGGKRRVRLDNDERRAQLLALAKRAFADRAYDDVSIDDLARVAAISKGLLYHYFPTKRDLYVAALTEIADELVEAVTRVHDDLAPIDRVRTAIDAYLDHITRHARAFVALMRGGIGSDPEVAQVIEGVRTQLFAKFLVGSPFATLVAGDVKFETAIRGWIGFVEATSIDWCANPRLERLAFRELLVEVLFQTLRVVGPGGIDLGKLVTRS
jgi:AcrR family transcriptional regulator